MSDIVTFPGRGFDCNSYLILDEKVILIDTGTGDGDDLRESVAGYAKKLDMIINTHAHYDHVGGNRLFDTKIAIHEQEIDELKSARLYGTAAMFGKNFSSEVDRVLKEGDIIETGEMNLSVLHTPGHTPGSICLLSNKGHLFSGDTLFSHGSFGRTDLPGGNSRELLKSLERLKRIDFEFLMPGHMDVVNKGKQHLEAALDLIGGAYEGI